MVPESLLPEILRSTPFFLPPSCPREQAPAESRLFSLPAGMLSTLRAGEQFLKPNFHSSCSPVASESQTAELTRIGWKVQSPWLVPLCSCERATRPEISCLQGDGHTGRFTQLMTGAETEARLSHFALNSQQGPAAFLSRSRHQPLTKIIF